MLQFDCSGEGSCSFGSRVVDVTASLYQRLECILGHGSTKLQKKLCFRWACGS
jgi:hypothetical protein